LKLEIQDQKKKPNRFVTILWWRTEPRELKFYGWGGEISTVKRILTRGRVHFDVYGTRIMWCA